METSWVVDVVAWAGAMVAVVAAGLVFRVDSMVRAAFWLLGSFLGVGVLLITLHAEFLGLILMLMMAGEMTIMAVFMVMFMMNPAGLNPMNMVHQHKAAVAAGVVSFLALASVGLLVDFPDRPADPDAEPTAELGVELLDDSMIVFQTAGVTLLAAMIGGIALASRRGRFGDAFDGSLPPDRGDADGGHASAGASTPGPGADDEHAGHGGHEEHDAHAGHGSHG